MSTDQNAQYSFAHLPYDRRPPTARLSPAEIDELCLRMMLTDIGMPRLCVLRRCRRKRRCFGSDIVCARHHEVLIMERYERVVGGKGLSRLPAGRGNRGQIGGGGV